MTIKEDIKNWRQRWQCLVKRTKPTA